MNIVLIIIILLIISFFVILSKRRDKKLLETVTKLDRGTKTERDLVLKLLKSGIPTQTIFHDLYVKNYYNHYSQIDLVVATKVGLIVFEVKNYSGWIFGTGHNQNWTQVLAYGKEKYKFYNPIHQNNKHIENLKKQRIQFKNIPCYSVIVFYGDCKLKDISFVPEGTFIVKSKRAIEVMNEIISKNEPARYTNKREIVNVLNNAVKNGEQKEIQIKHIENIKNMMEKDRDFE